MLASLKKKETYEHYLETLKFALYCIRWMDFGI